MGSIDSSVFRFLDRHGTREDTDRGRPIGSAPRYISITARRSRIEDGVVVFGEEEPLQLFPGVLRAVTLSDGRTRGLLRYEVKSNPNAKLRGPSAGELLTVSERPYSNAWFSTSVFKRGSHRSSEERQQVAASTLEQAEEELAARPHDPWESGALLTAAIRPPNPLSLFDEPLRAHAEGVYLFGVCSERERQVRLLSENEEGNRLVQLARERRMRLGPNQIPIHPRVAEDANSVFFVAINQALAGPDSPSDLVGEPVLRLAKYIFEDHLYNRTRRANREDGHSD